MQLPLTVYTRDGKLIAQIGEQRRIPVKREQVPQVVVDAFLASEDDRFFHHPGVDWQGLVRALATNVSAGGVREGGGTITMQLARNTVLTSERTLRRKLKEVFLALRIEREFTKEEILTQYLNRIFLGQRAYGIGAAAEVYFNKHVEELTLPEAALIAGLPRSPSQGQSGGEHRSRRGATLVRAAPDGRDRQDRRGPARGRRSGAAQRPHLLARRRGRTLRMSPRWSARNCCASGAYGTDGRLPRDDHGRQPPAGGRQPRGLAHDARVRSPPRLSRRGRAARRRDGCGSRDGSPRPEAASGPRQPPRSRRHVGRLPRGTGTGTRRTGHRSRLGCLRLGKACASAGHAGPDPEVCRRRGRGGAGHLRRAARGRAVPPCAGARRRGRVRGARPA